MMYELFVRYHLVFNIKSSHYVKISLSINDIIIDVTWFFYGSSYVYLFCWIFIIYTYIFS